MTTGSWHAVSVLADPQRRALFEFVRTQRHPVTREEAAAAERISRNLAAFHLDKLVDAGLLRARYQAPVDQPRGRGRTPKVYESVGAEVAVTIPERRYDFIAEILADAVAQPHDDVQVTARRVAADYGDRLGRKLKPAGELAIARALAGLGFEPHWQGDRFVLRNCPFHALAQRHRELVCGLNLAFVSGLLASHGAALRADLVPRPGACCVELRPTDEA